MRERDINLVMPAAPLEAVMSGEVWATVYDQLAKLIEEHHTTLIFANTRRMVERVSRQLAERLGETAVAAHHGSLCKETRFDAEQRLKAGQLKVMVATASLELGIDIGDVELVCQLGTPRSISVFLQRVGRANHSVDGVPKGRHFPVAAAMSWWTAWRCSTPCAAASWIGCTSPSIRSTCCRSRSSPKLPHANTARTSCST